jgi:hypothetical protein
MNKMKLILAVLSLVLVGILTSGCMQISQEVKVDREGAGIMVETAKFSPWVMEMIKGFIESTMDLEGGKPGQEKISPENYFPEEQFKEKAKRMGEGVEFLSREVKEFKEGMVGYVATYKISSIDKFILNPREEQMMKKPGTDTPITFSFNKGKRSSYLRIKQQFAKDEKEEKMEKETPEKEEITPADEKKLAQLIEMFKGMRIQIVIECGEEIEITSADWWDKNRITLLDFDVKQLLSHPSKLQMLSQMEKPKTKEDFRNLLQGIEGIKFDLNEEIEVQFR